MSTTMRFLGVAGFEIVGPRHRIVIDPCLNRNPLAPVTPEELEPPDLILVTHGAWNHLGDAALIAARTGAPVVCGADVAEKLIDDGIPASQLLPTIWGVRCRVADLEIVPIECHHWSNVKLRNGTTVSGFPLAFIFEMEPGVRIYHYGDTCIFDMTLIGRLYKPTVALLGCTEPAEQADEGMAGELLTGEMTPDEAGLAAEMLGVDVAVACHYIARNPDVDEFLERVAAHDSTRQRRALALEVGESYELPVREGAA